MHHACASIMRHHESPLHATTGHWQAIKNSADCLKICGINCVHQVSSSFWVKFSIFSSVFPIFVQYSLKIHKVVMARAEKKVILKPPKVTVQVSGQLPDSAESRTAFFPILSSQLHRHVEAECRTDWQYIRFRSLVVATCSYWHHSLSQFPIFVYFYALSNSCSSYKTAELGHYIANQIRLTDFHHNIDAPSSNLCFG